MKRTNHSYFVQRGAALLLAAVLVTTALGPGVVNAQENTDPTETTGAIQQTEPAGGMNDLLKGLLGGIFEEDSAVDDTLRAGDGTGEPEESTCATDSTGATGETTPTDATGSTEPPSATDAAAVTIGTEPSDASNPTETTGPADATETTGATEPTDSTGTTAPADDTDTTDPTETTAATEPELTVYESLMARLADLEAQAQTLTQEDTAGQQLVYAAITTVCDDADNAFTVGGISSDEITAIIDKATALATYLSDVLGFEGTNGEEAQTLDRLDGTSPADIPNGTYYLLFRRDDYVYCGIPIDASGDAFLGKDIQKEVFEKCLQLETLPYLDGVGRWTFTSTGTAGEYYIQPEGTELCLSFGNGEMLSPNPVVTKVRSYGDKYILVQSGDDGKLYALNQFSAGASKTFKGYYNPENLNVTFGADPGNFFSIKKCPAGVQAIPAAAENVKMYLFDYGKTISNMDMVFHQGTYGGNNGLPQTNGQDGKKSSYGYTHPNMKPTLVNGYPEQTGGRNYAYLFSPTWSRTSSSEYINQVNSLRDQAVNTAVYDYTSVMFPIQNTGNGTGLFQKDGDGYYWYDSGKNAAWYNPATQRFELYNYTVIPPYTETGYTGNFLPFNQGHTAGYQCADGKYRLLGATYGTDVDLWFGMSLEFNFNMLPGGQKNGKDMVFSFTGDDDVYVYIDDVLVLDIGGIHAARSGSINFATGQVKNPKDDDTGNDSPAISTLKGIFSAAGKDVSDFNGDTFGDWTGHTLKFFYMERGGNVSNCRIRFNMEPLPTGSVTISKKLEKGTLLTDDVADWDYTFRVTKVEEDGQEKPLANRAYTVLNGRSGKTNANGEFTIQANQTVTLSGLTATSSAGQKYRIREVSSDQYEVKDVTVTNGSVQKTDGKVDYAEFTVMPSDDAKGITHSTVFTNRLNRGSIAIAKTVKGNMGDRSKDFAVTLTLYTEKDGKQLPFPEGAGYTVDANGVAHLTVSHNKNYGTVNGITMGAPFEISNLPFGVYVEIREVGLSRAGYVTTMNALHNSATSWDGLTLTPVSDGASMDDAVIGFTVEDRQMYSFRFTNEKEATIQTGVSLDSLSYVLILTLVAMAVVLLLRRKNRYED